MGVSFGAHLSGDAAFSGEIHEKPVRRRTVHSSPRRLLDGTLDHFFSATHILNHLGISFRSRYRRVHSWPGLTPRTEAIFATGYPSPARRNKSWSCFESLDQKIAPSALTSGLMLDEEGSGIRGPAHLPRFRETFREAGPFGVFGKPRYAPSCGAYCQSTRACLLLSGAGLANRWRFVHYPNPTLASRYTDCTAADSSLRATGILILPVCFCTKLAHQRSS